ncbi:37S ribosomal protein S24, mitochondrial [Rhinocladiella similis]
MATTGRHLCRTLYQVSRQIPVKRKCHPQWVIRNPNATPLRALSTTCALRAEDSRRPQPTSSQLDDSSDTLDDSEDPEKLDPSEYLTPRSPITLADLGPEERADYDMLSKADQEEFLALQNHYEAMFESAEAESALDSAVDDVDRQVEKETELLDFPDMVTKPSNSGFWTDEEDEFGQYDEEPAWDDSAITSVAHSELEVHREIREYTRVIAWDMPLLNQYAKEFKPPTQATPLRFRYTTYMGEVHPAAKKVVVQFCTKDLPNLTEAQRIKLIKLVGVRYNPDTDMVKMSTDKFEAAAQNKRYLGDLINNLLDEAKNGKDTFEDIPLDMRHHKSKKKHWFPKKWMMKPGRVQELANVRKEQQKLLLESGATSTPPDGRQAVQSYVRALAQSNWGPEAQRQRTL